MTSHLESTNDCAQERMKQLRICFDVLEQKVPDNVTAFFGGDLNLRDKEVRYLYMWLPRRVSEAGWLTPLCPWVSVPIRI